MRNPFRFGMVVKGENFCDREKDMENVIQAIESGMSVSIISPRRYGKTSFVVNMLERLNGYKKVYLDLMGVTTVDDFLSKYSSAVFESLGGVRKFLANLENFVKIRGKVNVDLKALKIQFDVNSSTSDIESIVKLPGKFKEKFVIVMDEFQEIKNITEVDVIAILRKEFQFFDNAVFVFLGSKKTMMKKIFSDPQKPFYRFTQIYELAPLEKEKVAQFVQERFAIFNVKIQSELIDRLYNITQGHPYYIQALCYHLWFYMQDSKQINEEKIEFALEKVLFMENGAFENIWDKLTPNGKKVLKALAQNRSPYSLKMSAGSVKRSLENLENSDIVEKNKTYSIIDPLFKIWMNSKM